MSSESTGKVNFKVGSETYQTWYKVYGDLKNSEHRPIVALHGGPGLTYHHMITHKIIYEREGIPVVLYQQIGAGESSHCPGVPKEFWKPELFMDELDNILKALEICDDFDLLGQSWGGMLAAQYAATRTPKGLKRLIISNTTASMPLMIAGTKALLNRYPPEFVETMRKHEAAGTFESKEYQEATMILHKKHICTLDTWPEELNELYACFIANPTVYLATQGPSEFCIIGSLKDWSIVDILNKITYPTLMISAREDTVQEIACLPYFLNLPKIKWVEFQNSTHQPQFEESERYFRVVLNFLKHTKV